METDHIVGFLCGCTLPSMSTVVSLGIGIELWVFDGYDCFCHQNLCSLFLVLAHLGSRGRNTEKIVLFEFIMSPHIVLWIGRNKTTSFPDGVSQKATKSGLACCVYYV